MKNIVLIIAGGVGARMGQDIPKHEPIKKIYVEMVKQIVESEAKNDEDTE